MKINSSIFFLLFVVLFLVFFLIRSLISNNVEGGFYQLDYLGVEKIDLSSLNIEVNGPHLLTVIYEGSCGNSVSEEVGILNKKMDSFKDNYTVIYVGQHADYLNNLGAKFPYEIITLRETEEVFGTLLIPRNPMSFLFDENFVLDVRVVNVEKPMSHKLTKAFYEMAEEFVL
ncbi:MAG: hypothetical protein ED557_13435 [Balneola sp.]|nr:MAG: hypothetical protein ED557_13435 [Balneola sp.]